MAHVRSLKVSLAVPYLSPLNDWVYGLGVAAKPSFPSSALDDEKPFRFPYSYITVYLQGLLPLNNPKPFCYART